MKKVRIKGLPKMSQGGNTGRTSSGANEGLRRFLEGQQTFDYGMNQFSEPDFAVNKSITGVDREEANVEAEGGERVVVPGQSGIPEAYNIKGPRHAQGGVPLNLDEDSFVFSDHKKEMKIKDKEVLREFGASAPKKGKAKGKTPAELAKNFDLNEYKKILMDPNSDRLERETAEQMIKNYNLKLGKLALYQESMKGFPQGAPQIAIPYMATMGMDPAEFGAPQETPPQAAYGVGVVNNGLATYLMQDGGAPTVNPYQRGTEYLIKNGKIMNRRELMYRQNPEKQGDSGEDFFEVDYLGGKSWIPGKSYGIGENRFAHEGVNRSGSLNMTKGDYQFVVIGEGEEDPYAEQFSQTKVANPEDYQKNISAANKEFAKRQKQAQKKGQVLAHGGQKEMHDRFPGLDIMQRGGEFEGAFWRSVLQEGGEPAIPNTQLPTELLPSSVLGAGKDESGIDFLSIMNTLGNIMTGNTDVSGSIEVEEKSPANKKGGIPEKYKSKKYDASSSEFDMTNLKTGDVFKDSDGKWKKVTFNPYTAHYTGEDYKKVFEGTSKSQRVADNYQYIENVFNDPEVAQKLHEKTIAALKNDAYYKRKQGKKSRQGQITDAEIEALTPEDTKRYFLDMQKRNSALAAKGVNTRHFRDSDGKVKPEFANKYKAMGISSLNDAFDMVGMPLTPGEKKIGFEQATYWGYRDLLKDRENYTPELQDKLSHLKEPQRGESDEGQTGDTQISPIDFAYTNTSAGELAAVQGFTTEDVEVPEEEKDRSIKPGKPAQYDTPRARDEYWLQDLINMGNLHEQKRELKKYLPHSATVDLVAPDVLYYDPSRALAANAEQAAIAAQALSSFAGPQAASARMSGIQGNAFKNAANIAAEYEAKNVGIGNQYAARVADTMNKEHMTNRKILQDLYDKNIISNQQYDNSVRQIERNIADGWIQAETNRKMAQALNSLYPQFETIPSIGGGLYFKEGRDLVDTGSPGTSGGSGYIEEYTSLLNQHGEASKDAIKTYVDQKYGMSGPAKSVGFQHPQIGQRQSGQEFLSQLMGLRAAYGGNMY